MRPTTFAVAAWSLVKPRIVGLLLLTGVSGALAAGGPPPGRLGAFVVAGGATAAGSAALNCYYDRRLDRRMTRTADRPLPRGLVPPWTALALGAGLLAVGTVAGWLWLPWPSLAYMLLGALAYVGLYTVGLKRRHYLGTPIGGLAGAFPVLAGWSTVEPVGGEALLLAALVVAWTPAHAWALAFVYRDDFRAAEIPTLPAVATAAQVRRSVWHWALGTIGVAALAVPFAGELYGACFVAAAGPYLLAFRGFQRSGSEPAAVRAFFTANLFLAVLFLAWAAGGLLSGLPVTAVAVLALAVPLLFIGLWNARPSLGGVAAAAGSERAAVERIRARLTARGIDG
ncbi:MAG: protoheme IX farnesyltransferase [Halobacteriales archaeon]